ncbi:WXG100 family type VII secretion target [Streptomyces sp. NPDC002851]
MSILVNYTTITTAAQDVRKTAGHIKERLQDIEDAVRQVAQSWEGEAQEGYQRKQREWDKTAADLHQTLMKIAKALDNSAESYRGTEKANAQIWG